MGENNILLIDQFLNMSSDLEAVQPMSNVSNMKALIKSVMCEIGHF